MKTKNPKQEKKKAEVRIESSQSMEAAEECLSYTNPWYGLLPYSLYCFVYTVFPNCAIRDALALFVTCIYYRWDFSILVFPGLFKQQSVPRPLGVQPWIPLTSQPSSPYSIWKSNAFNHSNHKWWQGEFGMRWTKSTTKQQEPVWKQHENHVKHVVLH